MSEGQQPSVGALLKDLATETGALVRQEMALARAEMLEKAQSAAKSTALIVGGAAFACAATLALMAALIVGLGTLIPPWLSALVIGIVLAVVGFLLARVGLSRLKALDPLPERTIDSIKQVVARRPVTGVSEQWVKKEQAP